MKLRIFTDGAYSSSRSQGGIGVVILDNEEHILWQFSNMYKNCSNNQMEIVAVILALRYIQEPIDSITIYTDSMLVIGWLTKNWKRNKNQKLLKEADNQLERVSKLCLRIEFIHVKGHQKDDTFETKWNNYVDKLAQSSSQLK